MKKFAIPVLSGLFVLAIVLGTGCGGGGGGSSTTTTTSTTGLNPIRAEVALTATPGSPIDPLNIQAGDTVDFQVVGYDANRQRHIVTSSNWTTTDNANQAGQLQATGTFSATTPSGGTIYTATGTAGGKQYSETYRVKPVQALVVGSIMDSNGFSSSHISIVFYNSVGTEVSRAVSQSDGSFRASVPTSAKTFNLDSATVSTAYYYHSFVYQTKRYTTLLKTCNVTLPALTNGTTSSIGVLTLDASSTNGSPNPPPPPPDGCS